MNLSFFMASNNTTLLDPLHSSDNHSLTPETHRRRNSNIVIALRRRSTHKKYSGSTPVNFRQGFVKNEVSARKLAAGLWQMRFVEFSGDCGNVMDDGWFRSSMFKVCVYLHVILFFVSNSNNCCKLKLMFHTQTRISDTNTRHDINNR